MISKIYVPRDERFGHSKNVEFLADQLKAKARELIGGLLNDGEFDSFHEVVELLKGGDHITTAEGSSIDPLPQVIQGM